MSLLASAANSVPRDPNEKKKSRDAIGRNAAREGRGRFSRQELSRRHWTKAGN
jgi:hypothetical protein